MTKAPTLGPFGKESFCRVWSLGPSPSPAAEQWAGVFQLQRQATDPWDSAGSFCSEPAPGKAGSHKLTPGFRSVASEAVHSWPNSLYTVPESSLWLPSTGKSEDPSSQSSARTLGPCPTDSHNQPRLDILESAAQPAFLTKGDWPSHTLRFPKSGKQPHQREIPRQDFSGGLAVKTLPLQYRGCGFNPWWGNRSHRPQGMVKKKIEMVKKT